MAGSSEDIDDGSQLFWDVFTEGPLEELTTKCDIITAASLVGSSKLILESSKYSATLHGSQPFGLPCVLHSHLTNIPFGYYEYMNGKGTACRLTPLDRVSSDALMPNCMGTSWAGANGDWIATVGLRWNWKLVNVYTRQEISLPLITFFEEKDEPFVFRNAVRAIRLRKIAICKVPTTAEHYRDFCIIAIFDYSIAVLQGHDYGWTVLENQFQCYFRYDDATVYQGLVYATTERGTVYAWNPLRFGPLRLMKPPSVHDYFDALDDVEHEFEPCFWFLARSADGYKLLLVHTYGVTSEGDPSRLHGHDVPADRVHFGRTVGTYSSGFCCEVFSMDARGYLYPDVPWVPVTNLGPYSIFLQLNYSINIAVGDAEVDALHLTRSKCVYTSHHAIGLGYTPSPEICRFGLNGKDAAVGFPTKVVWHGSETPLWFIPSYANALDWSLTAYPEV